MRAVGIGSSQHARRPVLFRHALTLENSEDAEDDTVACSTGTGSAGQDGAQISERTFARIPGGGHRVSPRPLLTIWVAYATVHVFTGHWLLRGKNNYLTPFFSPCISGECVPGASSLGHWFPLSRRSSPMRLISLPFVLGFRLSCYYYRRAYYRAFWRSPAACAVREPHAKYTARPGSR